MSSIDCVKTRVDHRRDHGVSRCRDGLDDVEPHGPQPYGLGRDREPARSGTSGGSSDTQLRCFEGEGQDRITAQGSAMRSASAEWFAGFVDGLEELGFDSLWLPERLAGPSADPLVGLAFAAGRTKRLKLGTSVSCCTRAQSVVLAKELATLDALSGGRLLPAFGLGVARPRPNSRRSGCDAKRDPPYSTRRSV